MKSVPVLSTASLFALAAAPSSAQDAAPSPITTSGSATSTSSYRLRGMSQTDKGVAYVDTDTSRREPADLRPNSRKDQDGTGAIANGAIVPSPTASF